MFKKQHFGIRKFAVGAASIAVGATLFCGAQSSADAAEVDGSAWTNDNLGESSGSAYVDSNGIVDGQAWDPTLAEGPESGSAWVENNAVSSNVDGQAWTNDNLGEGEGSEYVDSNGNVDGQAWDPTLAEGPETGSAWVENNAVSSNVDGQAWTNDNLGESEGSEYVDSNGNVDGQAWDPTLAEGPESGSAWVENNAISSNVDGQAWTNDNLGEGEGSEYVDSNGNVDGQAWDPTLAEGPESGSAWVENNLNETVTATGEPAYAEPLPEGHIGINGEATYTEPLPEGTLDTDNDGYTDDVEIAKGTSTTDASSTPAETVDTDFDGYTDAEEVAAGTNLYDATSTPAEHAVGQEAIATDAHVANEATAQSSVETTPAQTEGQAEGQALPETGSTEQGTLFGGLVAFIGAVLAFFGLRRKA